MYRYKILLADDETEILTGISNIITKECDNIDIVACCNNGSQAISYLQNNPVDIVISDICMPVVSGIDIAKLIKEKKMDTHIILITGFRKFEYAADAIKYNVSKFITKPIDFDELINAVNDAKKLLSEKRMASVIESQNILRNRDTNRMQLLLLINGLLDKTNDKFFDESINQTPCAIIKFNCIDDNENNESEEIWQYMCEIDDEEKNVFCIKEDSFGATLLMLFKTGEKGRYAEIAISYSNGIKKLMKDAYNLETQYEITQYSKIREISSHNFDVLAGVYVDYLSKNNFAAQTDFLNIVRSSFNFDMLKNFVSSVIRLIDGINITTSRASDLISSAHTKEELLEILPYIDNLIKDDADNSNERIISIKNYISNHFDSNISLPIVAEVFNLNPSYLSRIFKNATGMRIGNYIMSVRMEKAKQLLSNDEDIFETAQKVGYNNISYFNKIFKEYTGVMPNQYKSFGRKSVDGNKDTKK